MKKITILIGLMIYSLGFAQTPEGTWKLSTTSPPLGVGPNQGDTSWWSGGADRACLVDDEYVFNADGSFQNVLQTETWLEPWQGKNPEGCGAPVAPHNGTITTATWVYSPTNGTITINGLGAYLGLAKVINGAEIASAAAASSTIVYKVTELTETSMIIDIAVAAPGWWRFKFTKKLVGQPVIGAFSVPTATEGDIPFDLVDPTSTSPGSFSYTSSNTAVATISGKTVFIVGPGTSTITANQAASGSFIAGSVNTEFFVHETPPSSAAPTPPERNPSDVISIYSGKYTNLSGTDMCNNSCWGQSTRSDGVDPGNGDEMKRMVKFNYQGLVPAAPINVTSGYKLHIDIYKTDITSINIGLINPGPVEKAVTLTPTVVGWNSFDIDVNATNFPDLNLANIIQMKLDSTPGNTTTYWDNLYFYKGTALGVSSFEKSNVKMYPNPVKNSLTIDANSAINRVSVYNILGQEVMKASPKSNSVTLQTNELQKGVYMITTEIDGKISTSKVVKE